ncbi:Pls/PosA family non-ribosomal peptide synthetase [Pseudoxanthobacter sp.]|uniref:Pls/PosA family non-ribosomal peptide synthetase n=1 Tax=Pseudoxanthobacter sp. TaxID=1925742 RepID=UPI002FDF7883
MNHSAVSSVLAAARPAPAAVLRGPVRPDLVRDEVLGELFAATVGEAGARTAYIEGGRRWRYDEVDAAAETIARGLVARNIGPGDVVGLWFARGVPLLIAQIAVTRAGAAWLPFDGEAPVERIETCLEDAGAKAILAGDVLAKALAGSAFPVLTAGALAAAGGDVPAGRLPARAPGLTPDHPAYLIYTSGSTGRPKGIVISHRNICHFLRAARETYGVNADDIVFQGASAAFDLSMEEIWLPYLAGAALFVAGPQMMADIDRLPALLRDNGITVLDTVPTLISLLAEDVPSLRIIILGGEACPPAIAARWCRPGRRLFNSYGPTEATVVATVAEVQPGVPVTIGRPIPNYTCRVVDEAMNALPAGVEGELVIGGPGVAAGYLARPDLTAQKFVANPFADAAPGEPVLYRTGDAVSIDENGAIAFHGRIDDQVKIRGFRVELGEIEARLAGEPGVARAAVVLRNDDGLDRLVGFLVAAPGTTPDAAALRTALARTLPAYMVPAHLEIVPALPVLSSGKVDRKALKTATLTLAAPVAADEPATATEAKLLAAAQTVFPGAAIPMEADFFLDLGGHSLLAARFVSAVRATPALAGLTLQDVYRDRTLRAMAAGLDAARAAAGTGDEAPDLSFTPPPLRRRLLCGLAQAATLPVLFALMTAQWLGVFVSYMLLTNDDAPFLTEALTLTGVYIAINLLTVAIALAGKWLIIGRTRPGRYPLWGAYYYRWWVVQRLLSLVHIKWFQGTPVMRAWIRALGGKVGRDALIYEYECGAVDLVTIGHDASIGGHGGFANAQVIGNELVIGTLEIGADAYIGSSVVLGPDVVVGEGAELADLTAVPAGTRIAPYETWDGSPARCTGKVDRTALPAHAQAGRAQRAANLAVYLMAILMVPPLSLVPLIPAFYVFDRLDSVIERSTAIDYHWFLPAIAWPTTLSLIALTVALIVVLRWVLLPRVSEGVYSVHSGFYVRKWLVALASEVTLDTLSSLYATVYMRGWYRLMGAKIGKGSEISTSLSGRYDLVDIGDNCFIADEVLLGEEDIRRGWMTLKPVHTGDRVFVGNSAVVTPGATLPEGMLIGIKSKPPVGDAMQPGETWFGSPAIRLPVRQHFDGGAARTFTPSLGRQIGRAAFEAVFNLSVPTVSFITFGTIAMELLAPSVEAGNYMVAVPLFVGLGVAMSVTMALIVVALKWLMMGTYRPQENPMWSWWALRTEAIAVMYSGMAARMLLDLLRGTPMLAWSMRLFGAKIGKGCYIDMTDITEFDCIEVGDFVAINNYSALQTHLYEDRVMKVGRVRVGNGVTIEAGSTVLYDTHVGDFARLGPLTVVMKGESIPANTAWVGAPAVPQAQAAGLAEKAAAAVRHVPAARPALVVAAGHGEAAAPRPALPNAA